MTFPYSFGKRITFPCKSWLTIIHTLSRIFPYYSHYYKWITNIMDFHFNEKGKRKIYIIKISTENILQALKLKACTWIVRRNGTCVLQGVMSDTQNEAGHAKSHGTYSPMVAGEVVPVALTSREQEPILSTEVVCVWSDWDIWGGSDESGSGDGGGGWGGSPGSAVHPTLVWVRVGKLSVCGRWTVTVGRGLSGVRLG